MKRPPCVKGAPAKRVRDCFFTTLPPQLRRATSLGVTQQLPHWGGFCCLLSLLGKVKKKGSYKFSKVTENPSAGEMVGIYTVPRRVSLLYVKVVPAGAFLH